MMELLIKSRVFFCSPGIDGVQRWTVILNHSGHNTTAAAIARDSFSLTVRLAPPHHSEVFSCSFFFFFALFFLSHTHSRAVRMNTHTNVTD